MIGIIGCGNMGQALIKGLKKKGQGSRLLIFDKDKRKLSSIKKTYRIKTAKSLEDLVSASKIIIIAVKPQDVSGVLATLRKAHSSQLIISIAAGITTAFIEKRIGARVRVIRAMPNLAAKVSMGICALAKGRRATKADLAKTQNIFKSVGSCIVLSEKQIDAATAISGSGPGYIYYFLYCLQSAATKLGFSKEIARSLTFQTAKGAVTLLSSKDDFLKLVNQVASKGGTTQAALKFLEKKKFKAAIEGATKAAKERAKKLSK